MVPTSPPESIKEDSLFDQDEEVLLVQEDGRIKMNKISSDEADDEGSRDGDQGKDVEEDDANATPRTVRRKSEGLGQRRVHRTWKHFYEEVTL